MKKSYLLVAALLMSGAATTFTSCIDTDEPAGITDMRGAKAELLRAKAQVELAEAAIRNAKAAWEQAQADLAAEKVVQEKLHTEYLQAVLESDKQKIQNAMELRAAEFQKELLEKQKAVAEAQAAYDKAIADIEVAMTGYKENAYAQALYNLLNNKTVTITIPGNNGSNIVLNIKGLKGVSNELSKAKNDLAELTRQLTQMEFSFDKATVIASVQSQLATEQGKLDGMKENLALYQDILNTEDGELGKLTARHEELKKQEEALDERANKIDLEQAEALKPVREAQKKLDAENALEVKVQFDVPAEIQKDFYFLASNPPAGSQPYWGAIKAQAQQGEDGKYTFPNGIEMEGLKSVLFSNLGDFINVVETERIITEGDMPAYTGQQAQYKAELGRYITGDEANPGIYEAAVKAWTDAKKAYTDAYNAGNYSDPVNNARAQAIKDFEAFQEELANAADAAAQGQIKLNYRNNKLKPYLVARKALDAFVPVDNTGTEIKAYEFDEELDKFIALSDDEKRFGSDIASGNINSNRTEGTDLYSVYEATSNDLGYDYDINPTKNNAQQVEKTYEEWLTEQSSIAYPLSVLSTNTITDYAYTAKFNYETVTSMVEGQEFWAALIANANNDFTEIQEQVTAANEKQKEIDLQKEQILAQSAAEKAKIAEERAGIKNIQNKLEAILNDVLGNSGASFDNLIAWVEGEVTKLQGGSAGVGNDEYWFNTNGSIPTQEAVVNAYTKLVEDLKKDDSTYKLAQERAIEAKKEAIAWQETKVNSLQAIFDQLNKQKDAYMKGMTGEAAPEIPSEGGEETPAE